LVAKIQQWRNALHVDIWQQHFRYSAFDGALKHGITVGVKIFQVKVAVCVYKLHGAKLGVFQLFLNDLFRRMQVVKVVAFICITLFGEVCKASPQSVGFHTVGIIFFICRFVSAKGRKPSA
jgi:hypothetical protein